MKRAVLPLLLAISLVTVSAAPAAAWGGHGGFHGGHHGGGGFWPGVVIGSVVLGAAALLTAPFGAVPRPAPAPAVVYTPPVTYAPPPVVYSAAPAYAAPPPAPAVPREVVYPNGKYVLYGDGVRQPWQWVWVPAAQPPAPPAPPQQ